VYGIYAMAASGRMQYDYKQTNKVDAVGAFRIERPSQRSVEEYPGLDLWWIEGLEVGW